MFSSRRGRSWKPDAEQIHHHQLAVKVVPTIRQDNPSPLRRHPGAAKKYPPSDRHVHSTHAMNLIPPRLNFFGREYAACQTNRQSRIAVVHRGDFRVPDAPLPCLTLLPVDRRILDDGAVFP